MDEAGEVDGTPVVACGEAAALFELAEATFDTVAVLVGGAIMRDGDPGATVAWDHRLGTHVGDDRASGIAVIGFVGEHGLAWLALEQRWPLCDVANLACGDDEPQGPAKRVSQHVAFGDQSASGTPHCLILSPPLFRSLPAGARGQWCCRS